MVMPIPPLSIVDEDGDIDSEILDFVAKQVKEIEEWVVGGMVGLVLTMAGVTGTLISRIFWPFEFAIEMVGISLREIVGILLEIPADLVQVLGRPAHEITGSMGPAAPIVLALYWLLITAVVVRSFRVFRGLIL